MRQLFSIPALGLFLLAAAPAAAGDLEAGVLDEINFARTHPAQYARELREAAQERDWRFAYEDPAALDEAIDFLQRQPALPPLGADRRLASAAEAHAQTQGPTGEVGHTAFSQRLRNSGVWAGLSAEAISYGYRDPRDVVRQLVVDSGVAGRGHRNDIFGRAYQLAGVGCGRHATWGAMCVIDFAGAMPQR